MGPEAVVLVWRQHRVLHQVPRVYWCWGGAGMDLGYRVVMGLMQPYLGKYHHIFADNYFTSVHLAEALLREKTYLCGTTRSNRMEYPKALAKQHLQPGKSTKWTNGNGVMLVKWHDKRDVCLIATADDWKDGVKEVRRKNQVFELTVPHCVQRYNTSMGGVDRMDQMRAYFPVGRSGRRWWKYLLWGFLNIAVVNAYVLWLACNRPLPANRRLFGLKAVKEKLVRSICDGVIAARNRHVVPPADLPQALYTINDVAVEGHPLVKLDGRKRVCQMCRSHGGKHKWDGLSKRHLDAWPANLIFVRTTPASWNTMVKLWCVGANYELRLIRSLHNAPVHSPVQMSTWL